MHAGRTVRASRIAAALAVLGKASVATELNSWQAGFDVCNGAAQEAARDQTPSVADLQCNSDDECYAPKNRCVKQADGEHAR